MGTLDIIRGSIRPAISIMLMGTIVGLAWILLLKFADADMAKLVLTFVLASGSTIVGFLFGERAAKK